MKKYKIVSFAAALALALLFCCACGAPAAQSSPSPTAAPPTPAPATPAPATPAPVVETPPAETPADPTPDVEDVDEYDTDASDARIAQALGTADCEILTGYDRSRLMILDSFDLGAIENAMYTYAYEGLIYFYYWLLQYHYDLEVTGDEIEKAIDDALKQSFDEWDEVGEVGFEGVGPAVFLAYGLYPPPEAFEYQAWLFESIDFGEDAQRSKYDTE